MGMEMSCQQSMRQELEIAGGVSSSVLKRTERKLFRSFESTDIQKNLHRYGRSLESYRSVIDWLYVKTLGPKAWRECHRFYADKGPPLRDLYTRGELKRIDVVVLLSVSVMEDNLFTRERWKTFCEATADSYSHLVHV